MSQRQVQRMRAIDLASVNPSAAGYLFRDHGDCEHAWKLVKTKVSCERLPREGTIPFEVVTVTFVDGTKRFFDPDDQVEIEPAPSAQTSPWPVNLR